MSTGLMMIVKDEAHVIERCLTSVLPFVDWWVIADTGSTDGTQDIVRRVMGDTPGELVERPWVSFGHNRQEVLDLARASEHRADGDYVLWIDADEQLLDREAPTPPDLVAGLDGYRLQVDYAGTRYSRLALVRLARPWRWVGPVHEYLDLPGATLGDLSAPTVLVSHDGARSRDPGTYRKDAALIETALAEDPGNPRLQFYLAQSLRDAGELEAALTAYAVRAANPGGWDQERYVALFETARLLERLDRPAVDAYLAAHQACPWRAEPLVELARVERHQDRFAVALLYARPASLLPMPGGEALFVDESAYSWRAWDEVAVSTYWAGFRDEAAAAAVKALDGSPDDQRLRDNLSLCSPAA